MAFIEIDDSKLINWLQCKNWTQQCPNCKLDTIFPYSLISNIQWCPKCNRVWFYRYLNPQNAIKDAIRYWVYLDDKKSAVRIK